MKRTHAVLLLAGLLCLWPAAGRAANLSGTWQVRSYTTTTYTCDGKKKVKGPVTDKPETMWLQVGKGKYVLANKGKKTEYNVRKDGSSYVLSGKNASGPVTIRLIGVKQTGSQLTFTSTNNDNRHQVRTVISWVCIPTSAQKMPPAAPASPLSNTRWELVEILYNDDTVVRPKAGDKMTLEFGPSNQVSGSAGINRFSGTVRVNEHGQLAFSKLAATMAANPPGSIADRYLRELGHASHFLFHQGMLVLDLPMDTGVMKFRPVRD
jgi:heat shock protein HslJ